MKTPKYYNSQEEKMNLYCIIKLGTEISLFSSQISKTCFTDFFYTDFTDLFVSQTK